MANLKSKSKNTKNKIVGGVKEAAGKVTGNGRLELKGKMQSFKPHIGETVEKIQEDITGKINKVIDKNKRSK